VFGRIGKRSVASYLCRLPEQYGCGDGHETGSKVSDGHLIVYGSECVVCCLFGFSVTQPGEVLLDSFSVLERLLELSAVSGHFRSSIVGCIEILCAAIAFSGIEQWVFGQSGIFIFGSSPLF